MPIGSRIYVHKKNNEDVQQASNKRGIVAKCMQPGKQQKAPEDKALFVNLQGSTFRQKSLFLETPPPRILDRRRPMLA